MQLVIQIVNLTGSDFGGLVKKGEDNTKTFKFSLDKASLDSIFDNYDEETKYDLIIICEETEAKYTEDGTPYPDWHGDDNYNPDFEKE